MPILALLTGCPAPAEVPEVQDQPDLDEICADMFANHPDDAALAEQVAWLYRWLERYEAETRDGYEVGPLDEATVDALDGEDRRTDGMIGVVVGFMSAHPVEEATTAMVAVDQEEIHPDFYSDYEVAYLTDLDCFLERTCPRLELTEDYVAHFILGVDSVNHTMNQYLWLEGEAGLAMVHRAWLPWPPEVDVSWLAVSEQFYLDAFLPWGDGHYRVQTTWIVYEQESVPDDTAMSLTIHGMQVHSENLEAWLDAQ
jgi:hypothetical protein